MNKNMTEDEFFTSEAKQIFEKLKLFSLKYANDIDFRAGLIKSNEVLGHLITNLALEMYRWQKNHPFSEEEFVKRFILGCELFAFKVNDEYFKNKNSQKPH